MIAACSQSTCWPSPYTLTIVGLLLLIPIVILCYCNAKASEFFIGQSYDTIPAYTLQDTGRDSKLPIYLVQQYFRPSDPKRAAEIDECLLRNMMLPEIDKIVLFDETPDNNLPAFAKASSRIEHYYLGHRMMYYDFFEYTSKRPEPAIWLLANSDIYFTPSIRMLRRVDLKNVFGCLLRWERLDNGKLEQHRHGRSQDVWFIQTPISFTPTPNMKFYLGKLGCDNAIATILKEKGYNLANPSNSIITVHVHTSNVRTWTTSDRIKYNYTFVPPTTIG